MKTLCFVNQKGGVGKTTSCLNIGAALQRQGRKVLLIDLDAQGSLTKSAGIRTLEPDTPTVSEVLSGRADAADAVIRREDLPDLLPGDIRLSGTEVELIGAAGRDFILKEALEPLAEDYDYALIDCSPSLSVLTLMALTASDGIMQLMQTVDIVRRRMNPNLKISGVIVTLYDARRGLDKSVYDAIKEKFPDEIFADIVRYNSKIAEAPTFGKDIFTYASGSIGAVAYRNIATEIRRREEK